MLIVAPGYLNERTLPYASDVFYHGKVLYFLPTGFHPIERYAVAGFPDYCRTSSKALPEPIWHMCEHYFENDKVAGECAKILQPLRNGFVKLAQPVYPRDRKAISESEDLIRDHPDLLKRFNSVEADFRFISREVLSHLLFEVFVEDGFNGVVAYILEKAESPEQFIKFIAAVCINRLKIFKGKSNQLGIYEHLWYPLLMRVLAVSNDEISAPTSDGDKAEHFTFKLFEALLSPLFGRCDSVQKAEMIATTAQNRDGEISALKKECSSIAMEIVLMSTNDFDLKQSRFVELVEQRLVTPIQGLMEEPREKVITILKNFLASTAISSVVFGAAQGANPETLKTAAASGAISALSKHLMDHAKKRTRPTDVLAKRVRELEVESEIYVKYLKGISVRELDWTAVQALEGKE